MRRVLWIPYIIFEEWMTEDAETASWPVSVNKLNMSQLSELISRWNEEEFELDEAEFTTCFHEKAKSEKKLWPYRSLGDVGRWGNALCRVNFQNQQ